MAKTSAEEQKSPEVEALRGQRLPSRADRKRDLHYHFQKVETPNVWTVFQIHFRKFYIKMSILSQTRLRI